MIEEERIIRILRAAPPNDALYQPLGAALRQRRPARPSSRVGTTAMTRLVALVAILSITGAYLMQIAGPQSSAYLMYKGGPGRTGEAVGAGPAAPSILWSVDTEPIIDSSPVVVDRVVYVVDGGDGLRALDLYTGATKWVAADEPHVGSPAIAGDIVIAGSADGSLLAYDRRDGALRWRSTASLRANSSPLVMDGLIIAVGDDAAVHAFHVTDGKPAWTVPMGRGLDRSIAGADGRIFVGSAGEFVALDASTGDRLWAHKSEAVAFSTPAVRDGVVYANAGIGESTVLFALDARSGAELWRFEPPDGVGTSTPSVDATAVYVASSQRVYRLDRTDGSIAWVVGVPRVTRAAIGLAGDTIYLFSNPDLHALDAQTGAERWRLGVGGIVDSGTTIVDGLVVAGTNRGRILVVGAPLD